MTLAAKLAAIMGDVGRIEKKGKVRSQGAGPSYNFAKDTDVMDAVIPKMAAAGIILVPEAVDLLGIDPSLSGKQLVANIRTTWHVTDGEESLRLQTLGQGADSGDKALPKAQSNARKYALFMLYHIVTGDDPDHWSSDEQPQDGERVQRGGARKPATTRSAATQRTPEEQKLIGELLEVPGITVSQMQLLADAVGVKKGEHATADQINEMLNRATTPGAGVPTVSPAGGGGSSVPPPPTNTPASGGQGDQAVVSAPGTESAVVSPPSPAPAPTLDDILAVTGGELLPPKPGTDEYKRLPAPEKAAAKAYWQKQGVTT